MTVGGVEGYREYVAWRNGGADLLNRPLAHREAFFANIAVRSSSRRAVVADLMRGLRSRPGLSDMSLRQD